MGKRYLIAVDIEGIHGIVGEPYKTATDGFDYELALSNAAKEANTVAAALFDHGAESVVVWPNHGNPRNIDYDALDPRMEVIRRNYDRLPGRFYFIGEGEKYDGIFLVGYHAREGTIGGVLAHTYDSKGIQYYKLDGKEIGEVELDSYIAGSAHGVATLMVSSDEACCRQARESLPGVKTVVTKYGHNRNSADLLGTEEVLRALYDTTVEAISSPAAPVPFTFPCVFEVRHTRMEDAERRLALFRERGSDAEYAGDAHTVRVTFHSVEEVNLLLFTY